MFKILTLLLLAILIGGCATPFPRPAQISSTNATASENQLFDSTFVAHGGDHLDSLQNLNVGISGKWKQLIRRIQPLVTDYQYRVDSQERLIPHLKAYAAQYTGPSGNKSVYRARPEIAVHYNGKQNADDDVLSSTALTADAFFLFLLGPLALSEWADQFIRIDDAQLARKKYHRLYLELEPGFGYSPRDEVVLWVDPETKLTKLIQITLEGHSTTKGAHVEVEYLDYQKVGDFVFPVRFFERVNAPIAIDAHAWHLTGIDINRNYTLSDLRGIQFSGAAAAPANTTLLKN